MMVSKEQLHNNYTGLEAVDVFLAKGLCESLNSQNDVMQND